MSEIPDAQQASPTPAEPSNVSASTDTGGRPKSSPAMLWIAGLLTAVVVIGIIGAIMASKRSTDDCLDAQNRAAQQVYSNVDVNSVSSLRNAAADLDQLAYNTRHC